MCDKGRPFTNIPYYQKFTQLEVILLEQHKKIEALEEIVLNQNKKIEAQTIKIDKLDELNTIRSNFIRTTIK